MQRRDRIGEIAGMRPDRDGAAEPRRLQRVLPALPRQAPADEAPCRSGDKAAPARPACRQARSLPCGGPSPAPRRGAPPSSAAIAAPRSGWRGAMMVSRPGRSAASRAWAAATIALLAGMRAGREPDRAAAQERAAAAPAPPHRPAGAGRRI